MGIHLVCWRCGSYLEQVSQPLTRLAQCPACNVDLHVCRFCRFYNPKLSGFCQHDLAEPARDIGVANFCHYFRINPAAYIPPDKSRETQAIAQLQALFGESTSTPNNDETGAAEDAKSKFDTLFKDK